MHELLSSKRYLIEVTGAIASVMPRFGGAFLYVAVATPLTLSMARAPCPLDVRIAPSDVYDDR
jgi:hypothetical protein